jgi:transcriptional regulator with XRE-family HTH domain
VQILKDKEFLIKLGKQIREIRMSKGLSQLDVGVAMDNYAEQVGRIERGKFNVTICTLKKISEALGVNLSTLLDFDY